MIALWVVLAGSAGAVSRFVLDGVIRTRLKTEFPYAIVLINVTGSAVLGIVAGLVMFRSAPQQVQAIIGVGFCGGFTTFSTASVETIRLLERRHYGLAASNAIGTALATTAVVGVAMIATAYI
ncbi:MULTISPECIES: fluoride efflux transporter CrcB [unclassified Rhodococcus (in: high G+C Gram-positive bacteria)]|uniref:fluoride efflux transporter CrcB n=1 Tax=unclassified Rhodococcus (in: high G+C Gram-positive bacteria) TaxID=192944 RepID=UPI000B9C6FC9|nr:MULTISPECIES: fluoride efflux transporter CrcB [unclassified Rhodococcus (in: high G+C Gram-positive bacteria)]OZE34137.1 chromosome condensation protein CrcB [Rhodococcus sp. 05-2254-4]OZE51335.1 chromosome condensation protein CrcB [Rhodococcus sp. 05-2254-3]OZE52986.1 chromosome condensation protein CrcB [Rhodococcus sp. 05-2254-2]